MARRRPNQGWVTSGPVANFMPTEIITEEHEDEHWDGTYQHLIRMARLAAGRVTINLDHIQGDKQDLALQGVTMAIVNDPGATVNEIIQAGQQEASIEAQRYLQRHGRRTDGEGTGGRFSTYWYGDRGQTPAADLRLEKRAVHEVFYDLDDVDQEVLLGAVAYPTPADEAEAIGLSPNGIRQRRRRARQAALNLWFDFETPPDVATIDYKPRPTECGQGHDLDMHGAWMNRTGRGRTRYCLTCATEANKKARAAA